MSAGSLYRRDARQGVPRAHRADERGGAGHPGRALVNPTPSHEAKALDASGRKKGPRGPLHGIPGAARRLIDVKGLPTTGGSIALQDSEPKDDSTLVAKLKAAGAIVLGKTNVTELNGVFDANMPEGYSSLGGQVLLPSDTDKTPAGSSAGSAAATRLGPGGAHLRARDVAPTRRSSSRLPASPASSA